MLGGKFISKGQYGCIFSPDLKCKDDSTYIAEPGNDLSYSKIIETKYANKEYAIAKRISKIAMWRNYFVISESMCNPSETQTEKDLPKCKLLYESDLSKFKLLKMPYGGMPLSSFATTLDTFDFMAFVKHLIEAGALLNLYGIIHRDLHNGNILVDKYNVPRIIDFNLTVMYDDDVDLRHQHSVDLFQEPPDSTLINAMTIGNYDINNVIKSIINKKYIISKIEQILGISKEHMLNRLEDYYNRDLYDLTEKEWFKMYWRTIDSWAIGVIILELFNNLSYLTKYSNILQNNKNILFPILRKMCAVNPIDRIDCVQALKYLDPTNSIIVNQSGRWLSIIEK